MQDLPDDAASISIVAGPSTSERWRSLDEWIASRGTAHVVSGRRQVTFDPATRISEATELSWRDEGSIAPGEIATHSLTIYFLFRRTPFVAYLDYKDKGGHAGQFRAGLTSLLNSFRPVATGKDCRPT